MLLEAGNKQWKKCSKVWLYFTKTDDNSAAVCEIRLSNKGGNTSSMLKHPSMQHELKLQESRVYDTLRTNATASQPSSTSVTEGKYPVMMIISVPRRRAGQICIDCMMLKTCGGLFFNTEN